MLSYGDVKLYKLHTFADEVCAIIVRMANIVDERARQT